MGVPPEDRIFLRFLVSFEKRLKKTLVSGKQETDRSFHLQSITDPACTSVLSEAEPPPTAVENLVLNKGRGGGGGVGGSEGGGGERG